MKRDEQSWRPERRKGGAAGKFLRLGHSKQLDPPPSEGARKGIPLHLSGWGGVGTPGLSHCQNPRQRNLFVSVWWAWASYLLPPGRNKGQKAITAWAVAGHTSPVVPPRTLAVGLTEALLEPDSSSALGGCAAFFRLRGLDRAAFLRLLGGLVEESSYSSAREKRSLNLRGTCFLR